jgi:hypothetical protein
MEIFDFMEGYSRGTHPIFFGTKDYLGWEINNNIYHKINIIKQLLYKIIPNKAARLKMIPNKAYECQYRPKNFKLSPNLLQFD